VFIHLSFCRINFLTLAPLARPPPHGLLLQTSHCVPQGPDAGSVCKAPAAGWAGCSCNDTSPGCFVTRGCAPTKYWRVRVVRGDHRLRRGLDAAMQQCWSDADRPGHRRDLEWRSRTPVAQRLLSERPLYEPGGTQPDVMIGRGIACRSPGLDAMRMICGDAETRTGTSYIAREITSAAWSMEY